MESEDNGGKLYERGEERFGKIFSRIYGLSRTVPTLRRFYSFALEDILRHEFANVLDIGSGTGNMLLSVSNRKAGITGTGIDPSPYMVRVASRNAEKHKLSDRIIFMEGSSRTIPGDGKFDLIFTTLSFHHWKDRDNSVKPIMQRLNPGGVFLIYEITDDGSFNRKFVRSHLMSSEDFNRISRSTGLKPELMEDKGYIRAGFRKNSV